MSLEQILAFYFMDEKTELENQAQGEGRESTDSWENPEHGLISETDFTAQS